MKTTEIDIKKTEQRIKDLEKEVGFYKRIADHTYDWEIFRDKTGKIVYVNTAFERITGYSVSDLLNGAVTERDFVHPDDYDRVIESGKQVIKQHLVEDLNFRVVRKDGTIRYVNLFAVPVYEDRGFYGISASIRDITLQKDFADLQKLRETSEDAKKQFRDFFDKAPDAILITEISSDIILHSNQAASLLMNLSNDQLTGMHQSKLKKASYNDLLSRLAGSDLSEPVEDFVYTSDGEEVPVEIQVAEVTFEGKKCMMEILRDITMRKHHEEELRIAIEHLKFHVDNSPFAVIEFDNKFRVTKWSEKAEKMFGWKAEEIVGKTMQDVKWIFEEDLERVSDLIMSLIAKGITNNININRNYRKDGSLIICEWNNSVMTDKAGKLSSVHSMVRDITESEELKKKLMHSRNLMQYVIEYDRSAIALLNRNLEYIYVSRKFIEDYRVTEKDVIGKHHYEVFPDLPEAWKDVHKKTLAGEIISSDEDQFPQSDGSIEWVRWESRPWYEPDNSIGGIILYTEVITKQKEAEQELRKSKERAEESDRLKTAFLQNMSHEVRTPLNSIVGFSELLTEPDRNPGEIKTFSRIIRESSNKLIQIISDVIEVSEIHAKQTSLMLKKLDLISLITSVVDDYEDSAKQKNILFQLEQNIPVKKSIVYSDYEKLRKITSHLIDNAIKFTDKGSVDVICEIQHDNFVLTVSDSGIGISEEMQLIIFEPFYQLDSRLYTDHGGNGLGLAIVRAYTDLLGGHISLKSEKVKEP